MSAWGTQGFERPSSSTVQASHWSSTQQSETVWKTCRAEGVSHSLILPGLEEIEKALGPGGWPISKGREGDSVNLDRREEKLRKAKREGKGDPRRYSCRQCGKSLTMSFILFSRPQMKHRWSGKWRKPHRLIVFRIWFLSHQWGVYINLSCPRGLVHTSVGTGAKIWYKIYIYIYINSREYCC